MADSKCAFKYVKTGPGELSGPSMIRQTELAINEVCELAAEGLDTASSAQTTADEALRIANAAQVSADNADAKAEEALANAQTAQDTADSANALANQALEEARAAQGGVESADARIDALETKADDLEEAVAKAQECCDSATTRIDELETQADDLEEAVAKAQETADTAAQDAATAQGGVDQNAADIASLDSQVGVIQAEISQMGDGLFEYDENTTDIDALNGQSARLYLTLDCTTVPDGVSAPYWLWNYLRNDDGKTLQFLRATDGSIYNREGTYSEWELDDGSAAYSLDVPHIDGESVTLTVSVADGSLGAAATQGDVNGPYMDAGSIADFTVTMSLPLSGEYEDGDEVTFNGSAIATYEDGAFTVNTSILMQNTYCNLTPSAASIDTGANTLDLTFSGTWRQTSGAVNEWSDWAQCGGGGGDSDWTFYTRPAQFGSSRDTDLEEIFKVMPDKSALICNAGDLTNSTLPTVYGMLWVMKYNVWRGEAMIYGHMKSVHDWRCFLKDANDDTYEGYTLDTANWVQCHPDEGTLSGTVGSATHAIYLNNGSLSECDNLLTDHSIGGLISEGNYKDVITTYDGAGKNRVGTIRIYKRSGSNTILLGAHNESNAAPSGLTVINTDGTITATLDGRVLPTRVAWSSRVSAGDVTTYTAPSAGFVMFTSTPGSSGAYGYVYVNGNQINYIRVGAQGYGEESHSVTVPVASGDVVSSNYTMYGTRFVPLAS